MQRRIWQKIFIGAVILLGMAFLLLRLWSGKSSETDSGHSSAAQPSRTTPVPQLSDKTKSSPAISPVSPSTSSRSSASSSGNSKPSAPAGESEVFPGTSWQPVKNTTALTPSQMNQMRLTQNQSVGQVSGFYLFTDPQIESAERAFNLSQPMVFKNQRTAELGIVTGKVQITLKENAALESLLSTYHLKVVDSFPHLKTFMVSSVTSPFDLAQLVRALERDSEIQSVEAEILSRDFKSRGMR